MNHASWCDYHCGPSGTAVPVRRTERRTASPLVYYACQPCREQRGLHPVDSVESLARTRMASTGETYDQAVAALRGEPLPKAGLAPVVQLRRETGAP